LFTLWKKMGPGLLYAGAAVGVSHLVQSTRAGAEFGFALIAWVVLANLVKFPFFEFGPRYTLATGKSILEGYHRLGKWVLVLFVVMTILTMFAIQAAVTVVTAGLADYLTGWGAPVWLWSAVLLVVCGTILWWGRFSTLTTVMKVVIVVLSASSALALAVAIGNKGFTISSQGALFSFSNHTHLFFLAALMGWMPAPIDVSVWQSEWKLAQRASTHPEATTSHGRSHFWDFHIGYWGTMLVALIFLLLGALLMYGSGEELSKQGATFASQLIALYKKTLGAWAGPIIAIAALTTMFSTTLTCLDAFPRVLARSFQVHSTESIQGSKTYRIWLIASVVGAVLMLTIIPTMQTMVTIATIISFVTAPLWAIMNLLAVTRKHLPKASKPSKFMQIYAWICAGLLTGFAVFYLTLIF
jgi:Mn2+/Fe2+ NRAMP family transporter